MGEKAKPSDQFSDEELERVANQGSTKEGKGNQLSADARKATGDEPLTGSDGKVR